MSSVLKFVLGAVPYVCLSGCAPCPCLHPQEHPQRVEALLYTASHSGPEEHQWICLRTAVLLPACAVCKGQTMVLSKFPWPDQILKKKSISRHLSPLIVSYLSIDLPLMVSHVSLSSPSRFSRCCLSWLVWALSWRLRPFFDVASYMGLFDLSSFWNS